MLAGGAHIGTKYNLLGIGLHASYEMSLNILRRSVVILLFFYTGFY